MNLADDAATKRIVRVVAIVILSLALPLGIVCASVRSAFSDKPLEFASRETKIYQGILKNGEMWFGANDIATTREGEWRVLRLDLESGLERETELKVAREGCEIIRLNDEIYARGQTSLFKLVDSKLERIATLPPRSRTFFTNPFLIDGQLSTVVETTLGEYRLHHLVQGNWVDGRTILLPGVGREWYDSAMRGAKALLPLTSEQPVFPGRPTRLVLQVIQQQQQIHLFVTDDFGFCAYRNGFEYSDEHQGVLSALAPENSLQEVSGWETIPSAENGDRCQQMACDRRGPFFLTLALLIDDRGPFSDLIRRHIDGRWENFPICYDPKLRGDVTILADPNETDAYVVAENQRWSSATVYRIKGNSIEPAHLRLPGFVPEYFCRWQRLLIGLFLAWLLHLTVLLVGTEWITQSWPNATFGNEIGRVGLARCWRRMLALIIDLSLMFAILFTIIHWQLPSLGLRWKCNTQLELCESFRQIEAGIGWTLRKGFYFSEFEYLVADVFPSTFFAPTPGYEAAVLVIFEALGLCCFRLYLEGRLGTTPGKWLVGIRTVRTTLRPAGFSKIFLRGLLYCADIPLLVTPLPAAISMMSSQQRQRLGDRCAQTIIVNANFDGNDNLPNQ